MFRKNVTYLIIVLTMAGCNAAPVKTDTDQLPSTPEGETQPTAVPLTITSSPSPELPTPTSSPAPMPTALPQDLTGEFNFPSRILPAKYDPVGQEKEMIQAYHKAVSDDSYHLEWPGIVTAPQSSFIVWVSTLSRDSKEKIFLEYPIRATITLLDRPAEHLIAISPMGGGGGGVINDMGAIVLQPGQVEIAAEGNPVTEMRYEDLTDIGHTMPITCGQTGVFNIHFEFDYRRVAENGDEVKSIFPYDVIFGCPASFTQYYVDTVEGVTKHTIEWVLKDGEYVQVSE